MRTIAARLALVLFVGPAFAQIVSVGVKTGVPLTDLVRTSGEIGGYPYRADISRFTIGPILDLRLPYGLGFEFGAMYKRFPQQAGQAQVALPNPAVYSPYSHTGQSWEFPMVGRYRFSGEGIRPYLEAGISVNHLSDVLGPLGMLLLQEPATVTPPGLAENRVGAVAGVGLDIKVPHMYLTPGLRYTHYGSTGSNGIAGSGLPNVNSVDFLVGFTF
jgi:hypothetical protein